MTSSCSFSRSAPAARPGGPACASLPGALHFRVRAGRAVGLKVTFRKELPLLGLRAMAESIQEKLDNYKTAPFDSRFPNQNQTRNCWQNYLDFHRCEKAMAAKGADPLPCQWYHRVYKSLCPVSWVNNWDSRLEDGTFPGKI